MFHKIPPRDNKIRLRRLSDDGLNKQIGKNIKKKKDRNKKEFITYVIISFRPLAD
jgi:hypothetical protein